MSIEVRPIPIKKQLRKYLKIDKERPYNKTVMSGIVYILTNPSMDGYIKIGKTKQTIDKRIKNLYSTGVPLPFSCYYACEVEDMDLVEKRLHEAFEDMRVNPKREFFEISPDKVYKVLSLLAVKEVVPIENNYEDAIEEKAINKAVEKRARFNFKEKCHK